MGRLRLLGVIVFPMSLFAIAEAHGNHSDHAAGAAKEQQPLAAPEANWATRHMTEEHNINSFDAGVFFQLHDYDNSGQWSQDDIRRTYGLFDASNRDVPEDKREEAVQKILDLYDLDKSGTISYAEFTVASAKGVQLPDLGFGPGHHGDDEYEYEIHHFEKFHGGDDVKIEDLTHPEDIEHFKMHERLEEEQEAWEKKEANAPAGIIEDNIPQKFRRD